MTVDPKIYALAESFVDDLFLEMNRSAPFGRPVFVQVDRSLVQRAAEAMQMAIEQECDAIRKELEV